MKYLVACDHEKQIVEAKDALDARAMCACNKCAGFILSTGEQKFKNVRVYLEDKKSPLGVPLR